MKVKTSVPGLTGGENCTILCLLVLTHYQHVLDSRTDIPSIPMSHCSIAEHDKYIFELTEAMHTVSRAPCRPCEL